ncbi:MAG: hypothetical protein O2910_07820, partial [Proteobacteria bacterium]|nr:hypothetical protein [Pseudomonadota bacterium]
MLALNQTLKRTLLVAMALASAMALAAYASVDATAARGNAPTASSSGFAPQLEFDKPVVLEGEEGSVYLRVHFDIPEDLRLHRPRPPLNLALVIDRSGSMDDKGKMTYAKQAASMIVDRLSSQDRLAVLEYDD